MEVSEKTNFTLRIILFILSLYFLFDITDQYKEVETTIGIGIIIMTTIIFGAIFLAWFRKKHK
jgi:L-lactate permease